MDDSRLPGVVFFSEVLRASSCAAIGNVPPASTDAFFTGERARRSGEDMDYLAREDNLSYLNDLFDRVRQKRCSVVAPVRGRRGVGKTSLVLRAAEKNPDLPFVYLYAFRTSERDLARRWGEEAVRVLGYRYSPSFKEPIDVLRFLFSESEKRPLAIFVDECPDIAGVSPAFWSSLQCHWDLSKDRSHWDYDEPFYARHNALIELRPFRASVLETQLRKANPKMTARDLVLFYAMTGGVPGYVEKLLDAGAVDVASMVEAFFREGSFFIAEASLMLADELRVDSHHYAFLLTEIAKGVTKREDLQKRLADVQVGGYLDRLQYLYGMVKKVEPVVPMGYRRARYDLEDPYLLFWHAFVAENADLVGAHRFDELKRRFYERWDDFSVRFRIRWLREKIRESCFYFKLGPWWDRRGENEIDLIAADEKGRVAWAFEVERTGGKTDSHALRQKAAVMQGACRSLAGFDLRTKVLTWDDLLRPVEEFAPLDRA